MFVCVCVFARGLVILVILCYKYSWTKLDRGPQSVLQELTLTLVPKLAISQRKELLIPVISAISNK